MVTKRLKAYKVRLYPNKTQEVLINKTFGCCRFLFNQMLNERKEIYQKLKKDKNELYTHKYKTEKEYKQEYEFLKEVDSIALQQSRRNLENAFNNFFKSCSGKRKGKRVGYPKFKSKKDNSMSYYTTITRNNIDIVFENQRLKLPKLKWVKYKDNRVFNGIIINVTVSKEPSGKYYASILVEEVVETQIHQINSHTRSIGLDYDSKNLFTENKGGVAGYLRFFRLYEKKLARAQRKLSHKIIGSNNRNKQRIKVTRIHETITNSRKDFQQKLSTQLVRDYDIIGVESLNMQAMSQCLNLGKSTMDNAWGYFIHMLEYKCEWYGKHLVFADKFYASSKMCNVCGYKNITLTLSDRVWYCPICGTHHNRDTNAAINLMNNAVNSLTNVESNTVGTTGINACGDSVRLGTSNQAVVIEARNILSNDSDCSKAPPIRLFLKYER